MTTITNSTDLTQEVTGMLPEGVKCDSFSCGHKFNHPLPKNFRFNYFDCGFNLITPCRRDLYVKWLNLIN